MPHKGASPPPCHSMRSHTSVILRKGASPPACHCAPAKPIPNVIPCDPILLSFCARAPARPPVIPHQRSGASAVAESSGWWQRARAVNECLSGFCECYAPQNNNLPSFRTSEAERVQLRNPVDGGKEHRR